MVGLRDCAVPPDALYPLRGPLLFGGFFPWWWEVGEFPLAASSLLSDFSRRGSQRKLMFNHVPFASATVPRIFRNTRPPIPCNFVLPWSSSQLIFRVPGVSRGNTILFIPAQLPSGNLCPFLGSRRSFKINPQKLRARLSPPMEIWRVAS